MPKYKIEVNWSIEVTANTKEEALDEAYWHWDQDHDFSRDAKITRRRK
jgi:hypothetical protein